MIRRFRRTSRFLRAGFRLFTREVTAILRNPVFAVITILGNAILLSSALLFLLVERGTNPAVHHYGDALWWAAITMTTVGYGDVTPMTAAGKFLAVFVVFTSGALFFTFLGLLSAAIVRLQVGELEREVHELERSLREFRQAQENK
ncbi:MAG: potassium channel family protein [Oligoflexia bacterium]|nr:potassium channel family protein [Oligoflexia bacterium]